MSEARATAAKANAKPKTVTGRLIEVRGLDKTFYDADREIRVLRNLELNVEAGEEIVADGVPAPDAATPSATRWPTWRTTLKIRRAWANRYAIGSPSPS